MYFYKDDANYRQSPVNQDYAEMLFYAKIRNEHSFNNLLADYLLFNGGSRRGTYCESGCRYPT